MENVHAMESLGAVIKYLDVSVNKLTLAIWPVCGIRVKLMYLCRLIHFS